VVACSGDGSCRPAGVGARAAHPLRPAALRTSGLAVVAGQRQRRDDRRGEGTQVLVAGGEQVEVPRDRAGSRSAVGRPSGLQTGDMPIRSPNQSAGRRRRTRPESARMFKHLIEQTTPVDLHAWRAPPDAGFSSWRRGARSPLRPSGLVQQLVPASSRTSNVGLSATSASRIGYRRSTIGAFANAWVGGPAGRSGQHPPPERSARPTDPSRIGAVACGAQELQFDQLPP